MIIAKIFHLFLGETQPGIPLTSVPLLVLKSQTNSKDSASDSTHPYQRKGNPITDRVPGFLCCDVYVAGDDATRIAEPDLHGRADTPFVVAAHVIAQPYQSDRLSDVATSHNEVDGKVASTDRDRLLREQDDVTYACNYNAEHGESIAMPEVVREDGR